MEIFNNIICNKEPHQTTFTIMIQQIHIYYLFLLHFKIGKKNVGRPFASSDSSVKPNFMNNFKPLWFEFVFATLWICSFPTHETTFRYVNK